MFTTRSTALRGDLRTSMAPLCFTTREDAVPIRTPGVTSIYGHRVGCECRLVARCFDSRVVMIVKGTSEGPLA
jgi:hypothetical protein